MFQAQLLMKSSNSIYSPWFPRKGDHLQATADLVDFASGGSLTIDLVEKNSEDPGNGTARGATLVINTKIQASKEWNDVKELVRYKFTAGGSEGDWVLFRMLTPVWFDAVAV